MVTQSERGSKVMLILKAQLQGKSQKNLEICQSVFGPHAL